MQEGNGTGKKIERLPGEAKETMRQRDTGRGEKTKGSIDKSYKRACNVCCNQVSVFKLGGSSSEKRKSFLNVTNPKCNPNHHAAMMMAHLGVECLIPSLLGWITSQSQ